LLYVPYPFRQYNALVHLSLETSTYSRSNAGLLNHAVDLSLGVRAASREGDKGVCVAVVGEATLADAACILSIEQRALESNVGVAGAQHQLVGSSGDERTAVGRLDHDALVDRSDVVRAVVERGEDVGTVGDLQIALFGQRWRFYILLGYRNGQSFLSTNEWMGERGNKPFGPKATVGVCSRVNRRSWPKDLGSPSGVGLQMYGGTSEPLVKAKAGAATVKAARMIV
jgi:hypothetical protein